MHHLPVLLERQRDVKVVDPLALHQFGGLLQRAEQRQSPVAQVISARAVVHEADDLEAHLAVLENPVRHEAPQLAGARDQDALQADPGAPAALQHLADQPRVLRT